MASDSPTTYTAQNIAAIVDRYATDPAGFCEDILGMDLDDWQRELCADVIKYDRNAISSGHGIGKTAICAGIIQWFIAVHPQPAIVVTANTMQQLGEKTWRELSKWHDRSLIKDWFQWTATRFALKEKPATWFAAAVPQTEHNSEAFAGAHEKYILQVFDEGSRIPASIYEVAEGATATEGGYRKWLVFGNPTLNSGEFHEITVGRKRHRWNVKCIDARACRYSDKAQIQEWVEDYGEDSDFVRVRVRGLPPKAALTTLIPSMLVDAATKREVGAEVYRSAPKVLGVDCARYGDDETVICYRQGLKVHWLRGYRGLNEMEIAAKVYAAMQEVSPAGVFIDVTGGYGAGAYDRLKELGHKTTPVHFSETPKDQEQYQNKRIEMWDSVREWLAQPNSSLPADNVLRDDLIAPELLYNVGSGKKQLESKKDVKKRTGKSPDRADALALTFAHPVGKKEELPTVDAWVPCDAAMGYMG